MPDLEKFFGSEDWNMDFVRAMLAEFIGSFFFVLIGILCTSFKPTDTEWQFASPVQVAFALGCITFSISHALGRISGAHLSPMVSLGLFLICGMSVLSVIGYIFAQFLGGLAAIGIISLSPNEEMYKENCTIRPMMGASYLEICTVVFGVLYLDRNSNCDYRMTL
ncbi:aquaporin AQPAn.G-like [Ceratitis capitata]|uniref:aquaporin AQPAn.G-like n=1 Tax=Ceratitis capitata TaxID=7213 RepID=UPI000A102798|nr:aquaporin AQPAn.G-like [Ceratitis capitata]